MPGASAGFAMLLNCCRGFVRSNLPLPHQAVSRRLALSLAMACSFTVAIGCGSSPSQGSPGTGGGAAGTSGGTGGSSGGMAGSGGSVTPPPQTCVPPADKAQPAGEAQPDRLREPERSEEAGGVRHSLRGQQPAVVRRGRQGARHGAARRRQDSRQELRRESRRVSGQPRDRTDDGKWLLPVGTVMVKSFLFDGKFLETRLLVQFDANDLGRLHVQVGRGADRRHAGGEERDQVSFATGQRTVDWHFPSRQDCDDVPRRGARALRSAPRPPSSIGSWAG